VSTEPGPDTPPDPQGRATAPEPPPATFLARYGVTIALCTVAALFFGMPQMGFMLYLFAFPWLVYALYNAVVALKVPAQRRLRIGRLLIWIVGLGLVLGVHKHYQTEARADAERAIMQVSIFRQRHGRFPDSSEEAALDLPSIAPLHNAKYLHYQGMHLVMYRNTWQPFGDIQYDLDRCIRGGGKD